MPTPWVSRVDKKFQKTLTLSNAAGSGAIGTVAVGTITGLILVTFIGNRATTTLAGATATVALGTTNAATALIGATTATNLTAGKLWQSTTVGTEVDAAIVSKVLGGPSSTALILTVATANITAGVLEINIYWRPLSSDGNLA